MECLICKHNSLPSIHKHESKWKGQKYPREFYFCKACGFVFWDPNLNLSQAQESERYSFHENDLTQKGYREFFDEFWRFLQPEFQQLSRVLDLGCGPTRSLQEYLKDQKNIEVDSYDYYFQPNLTILQPHYMGIWCQEVFEHIQRPHLFIEEWIPRISCDGFLALRTQTLPNLESFPQWHYHRDHTHISFFTQEGLVSLFESKGLRLVRNSSDMFLFKKR